MPISLANADAAATDLAKEFWWHEAIAGWGEHWIGRAPDDCRDHGIECAMRACMAGGAREKNKLNQLYVFLWLGS